MRAHLTTRHRPLRAAAGLSLLVLALTRPATAQGLDYGALEQLFGEPVTTSATGKPQRASDVPVAMDIITAEQIRRSGAHDIPSVLARYTSLDVQQYGAVDYSVGVRGLTTPMSQRLLVLLDGRQVYSDDYGRTLWESIPVQLTEIRQIEVIKGPNSALYGFNAVGGVVNIVTFNPAYDRVTNAVARIGTHGYRELSGVATAPVGSGGVRLSAGLREQTERTGAYDFRSAGQGGLAEPFRYQAAASGLFRPADGVRLGFDASYGRVATGEMTAPGSLYRFDERVWSLRGRLSAETAAGILDASVYHNGLELQSPLTPATQGVTVVQLSDTLKLGTSHVVRPSLEYRHNAFENSSTGARIAYDVAAIGAMWNWTILDGLESTLAGRWDQLWQNGSGYGTPLSPDADRAYSRSYGTFAWNAGLVWKPSERDTLRISAARGIGSPSLVDLGVNMTAVGVLIRGNPALNPTVVDDYELGWRRQVAAIDGRIGLTGFYQVNRSLGSSIANAPVLAPGASGPVVSPTSVGNLRVYGTEVSGAGRLRGGFDWGVEYRLIVVEGEQTGDARLDYRRASPRHIVSARAGWGSGPFQADLFLRYAGLAAGWRLDDRGLPAYVTVQDYVAVAARLAYRISDRFTVALEGSNLLQERQRQSIGLDARRQVFLSLRADF